MTLIMYNLKPPHKMNEWIHPLYSCHEQENSLKTKTFFFFFKPGCVLGLGNLYIFHLAISAANIYTH